MNKFKSWLLRRLIDYALPLDVRGLSDDEKEDLATLWEESSRSLRHVLLIAKHNVQIENMKSLSDVENAYNRGQYRMAIILENILQKVYDERRKQELKKRKEVERTNRFNRITKRLRR